MNGIIFASDLRRVKFRPEAGLEIVARGSLDLYPPTGKFQIRAFSFEPVGVGVLQFAAASGLPAAGAYVCLVGLFLYRAVKSLKRETRPDRAALLAGTLLAVSALSIAGLFEYNFGDTEVEMATLLVLAMPFSLARDRATA